MKSLSRVIKVVELKMNGAQELPMITVPRILLSSPGSAPQMPGIGMGTAADPFDANALQCSVIEAIKLGYRHFDTASSYGSEEPLGEAIAKALKLGLVSSRKELFITSKLWPGDAHYDCVLPALQESLRALRLNYLDLYLIHWPISYKRGKKKFEAVEEDDLLPMDFKAVWQAMEECQRLGLTSSIGVCNFSCKKLQNLLSVAKIPPSVNQVEMNPVWQQKKLRKFCKTNGVLLTAYSPLGGKGCFWGTDQVMDCQILKEIAQARNKTVAQVSLRWVYEQGVSLLVKSFNRERMKENLRILDWALTEDDYDKINKIQQSRGNGKHNLISPRGPYKSLDDLWDGEI